MLGVRDVCSSYVRMQERPLLHWRPPFNARELLRKPNLVSVLERVRRLSNRKNPYRFCAQATPLRHI